LRDAAGLTKDLLLYLARHRFGTEALRAGVPTALWPVSGTAAKSGGPSHAARPQVSSWGTPASRRPKSTCTAT
jgi:hypothetical protein